MAADAQATVLVSAAEASVTPQLVHILGGTLIAAGGTPAPGRLALELGRVELAPGGLTLCLLGCRRDDPADLLFQAVSHGVLGHLLVVGPGPVQPIPLEVLSALPTVVALTGRAGEKAVRTALRSPDVPLVRCDLHDRDSVRTVLETLLQRARDVSSPQ